MIMNQIIFLLQDLFDLNNDLYLSRNTYNYKHRSFSYVGYGFGSHVVYSDKSYSERKKKCAECFDKLNKINKSNYLTVAVFLAGFIFAMEMQTGLILFVKILNY